MPKPIRLIEFSDTLREQALASLDKLFQRTVCDTKLTFDFDISAVFKAKAGGIDKAVVYMTPTAYIKMMSLVQVCDKEMAAHGVVKRLGVGTFLIHDILVYPQEIAGAAVDSNDEGYAKWLDELPDDTINNLRFQMHSHVNMSVYPSGADTTFYNKLLQGIRDYYIFFIVNKRFEIHAQVYDVENNLMFDKNEVLIGWMLDDVDTTSWAKQELEKNIVTVIQPTVTTSAPTNGNYSYPNYDYRNRDRFGQSYVGNYPDPTKTPGYKPEIAWRESTAQQQSTQKNKPGRPSNKDKGKDKGKDKDKTQDDRDFDRYLRDRRTHDTDDSSDYHYR